MPEDNIEELPRLFPDRDWECATPESQGIDSGVLSDALSEFEAVCGTDKLSQTLLIRHGKLVWQGPHIDSAHNVWSCTKSFGSIVLGLLVEEGKCSLETLLCEIIPELRSDYSALKIRHLVTLTSGFSTTDLKYPFIPASPAFAPGDYFHYDSSGLELLSRALTILADEPLDEYFTRKVAEPIGFKSWNWGDYGVVDKHRVNGFSGVNYKGITTNARQMARIGWLLMNKGSWNGKQILPADWIADATRPQTPATIPMFEPEAWYSEIHGSYGYCFWANGTLRSGEKRFPNVPDNIVLPQGNVNNFCFGIPDWDLLFVRLGTDLIIHSEHYDRFFAKLKTGLSLG